MAEIGSEFQYRKKENGKGMRLPIEGYTNSFTFSGRNAIETVLKNEPSIYKAFLPSYCCDSMIEPFRRAGIEIGFYPVYFDGELKIELNIPKDVDCVLWCNYFGFKVPMSDLSSFINRGGIVIEDITHSFYSSKQLHEQSTYVVASLRKWEPILCGGYCASRKGLLNFTPKQEPSKTFLELKKEAMEMKADYLSGVKAVDKSEFLHKFSDSNLWLANNYSGLTIDSYSREYLQNVDYEIHKNQRIKNAKVLYTGLENNHKVEFLFSLESMDCPLFVPVIIREGKRDLIRKKLIDHNIYCPVHWPHPKANCESNLYNIELSLVCDQRYNEKDMKRIVDVLRIE